MLNENVKKILKESMWDLATCGNNEPNVVPVAFKDVTEDGKLVVAGSDSHGTAYGILEISRSTYYRLLKKAYICFYYHLIGVLRSENIDFHENAFPCNRF